jgi:hypothetical protein
LKSSEKVWICRALLQETVEAFHLNAQQAIASMSSTSDAPVSSLLAACEAFAALMALVKEHSEVHAVMHATVKWGGKFVEQLMKVHT